MTMGIEEIILWIFSKSLGNKPGQRIEDSIFNASRLPLRTKRVKIIRLLTY